MLAVEICSACYYVDDTLETVVGNAICADGASAFLLTSGSVAASRYPRIVDFQSLLDPEQLGLVGMTHRNGKLRIVLGAEVPELAPSLTGDGKWDGTYANDLPDGHGVLKIAGDTFAGTWKGGCFTGKDGRVVAIGVPRTSCRPASLSRPKDKVAEAG